VGLGVEKNYYEAANWYRKAAEQGDAFGQSNLGVMYQNGYGVEKDEFEAIKWYQKAAKQGQVFAQKQLTKIGLSW
jgi:TPR repeat protein